MRLLIRGFYLCAGVGLLSASAVSAQVVYVLYLKERSQSVGEGFLIL